MEGVPGAAVFKTVVVLDFEYETEVGDYGLRPGDPPRPLCMVAHILDHSLELTRIVRLWRDEFGARPPFDTGPETLVVAYAAWAELQCFLERGWPFPEHVLDLHIAYLAATNILPPRDVDKRKVKPPRKRLPDACRAYGLEGWDAIDKGTIAADIGKGLWRKYGREAVLVYCEEDVAMTVKLLRAMAAGANGPEPIDTARIIHWSEYGAKCVARIQTRGIPIDVALWNVVQENKAAVITALVRRLDPSYWNEGTVNESPVRVYTPEGGWSDKRFERWLVWAKVPYWPRLASGKLDLEGDTFELMSAIVPAVAGLHVLRDTVGFIAKARLPIGRDGRNRPSLFPLGAASGRNAHRKSPYNAHAGVRGFILAPEGSYIAYCDWRSQEPAIGASVFHDRALRDDYLGGDIYHSLAKNLLGWTNDPDRNRWKREHLDQRDKAKIIQLGVGYGMTASSLATHLKRHPLVGEAVMNLYARRYHRFWRGRERAYEKALEDRKIVGADGWALKISHSPNERSLFNYPCQSGGAYQMRETTIRMCNAGIVPSMPVHDAFLLQETDPLRIEEAEQIMRDVASKTCGFPVDAARDQFLQPGERYCDKRKEAQDVWKIIMDVMMEIGALKRGRRDRGPAIA